MAEKEQATVTGLDMATDRKDAEYDLVKSLLAAMDYQKEEENITEVEIRRNGKFYFSVHLHPMTKFALPERNQLSMCQILITRSCHLLRKNLIVYV